MTTKTWLAAVGCACALAASGMPTQAELEKVQGLVTELMRSDVANFNARKMSAADVATSALKYAGEAQSEAARFLLLKGAFFYRVRAEDYDGAMNVISKIRHDIKDVPDATLVKILSSAIRRIPRKSAGRLYDLHQRLQNRVRYAQEVKDLTAKIKSKPSDKSLRTTLGERYALLGEWDKAIPEFAEGNGSIAKAAALEQSADAKPGDVADAWWEVAGTDCSDISLAYRAHAVRFYRTALAGGSLPGLKKTIAAKRIEEVKADGLVDESVTNPSAVSPSLAANGGCPKPLTFDLGKGVKLELVGCPAGTFTMGHDGCGPQHTPHKVTISRPFWAGKHLVTREQWDMFMPPREMNELERALGGAKGAVGNMTRKEADDFCRHLTSKYSAVLPDGYVFRLPTMAEHEYLHRANSTDPNDPYAKPRGLNGDEMRQIAVGKEGKQEILRRKNVAWNERTWRVPGLNPTVEVGLRKPNAWGIYDCIGNADQWVLDISPSLRNRITPVNDIHWQDATDPVYWGPDGVNGTAIFRTSREVRGWAELQFLCSNSSNSRWAAIGFRLVVAPDLLKERGIMPLALTDKAAESK